MPATTREISYAATATSPASRALIRLLENSTGRLGLIRRAAGYEAEVQAGACFFEVMAARYGLSLEVMRGSLDLIPREGPVIFIANHPYGILDGLMLGQMMSRTRKDFRIMAHSVFDRAPDLQRYLLPISFGDQKSDLALNLATRRRALAHLGQGGTVGLFPGGTVSTGARPFSKPMDPGWRNFTARMIAKSEAQVVPVYFEGHTSRMFQIASHLHASLRLGLLIKEFRARVDTPVRVAIGAPLGRDVLDPLAGDAKAMMDFLRKATYELSKEPVSSFEHGFEFEQHHRA
ncbi:Phospholipid/glycerol acyltransferase [Sulfitobacter noctilucae]|uniref:lysophospholipid acyltransferase family protein n=1 Tax=Sulfitobacter noctilucae TaxID=1342302 RepID=UPI00046A7C23|nr:lysophospholipid acyltransferase family protein [Sulfitobacter noctilucae]KIN61342.1 Phospholipid/glycerol acyltransferase [Sulfitobacter noctilucae]